MALTPMMQQYMQVKEKCKDCILFFRLGDFYEMFFEDAEVASRELELVLTGRDCGLENRAPMCGIPYHAANSYISRLISKGYKIAICEQMEDPSVAKGIVRRDIIKVVTPGTYTDSGFLEENKNNYIMSIFVDENSNHMGICFADISTGDFYCTEAGYDINIILDEIAKFHPKELLVQDSIECLITDAVKQRFNCVYTIKSNTFFNTDAILNLESQFAELDCALYSSNLVFAANGLLSYINETQKQNLCNISLLEYYSVNDHLAIDINSRRNLEIAENVRDKGKKGSLLWVIDKTSTSMGARMLRKWVEQPLIRKNDIELRLDAVDELTKNLPLQDDLRNALKSIYDIERIIGKIASRSVNAKEMLSLKNSLSKIPDVKDVLKKFTSSMLKTIFLELDEFKDIYELLHCSIIESPSLSIKEGSIIKNGFSKEVDELRNAKAHGKEWIASLENNEKEVTGIKSLKVGYNKVFGYYIEITNANKELIPEGRYIRKQTLSNAERYITPELKEMEDKILGAEEKLITLEYELFINIRNQVEEHVDRMKKAAKLISEVDCLLSLATVALENNYCKPSITQDGKIVINEGRHPVVEKVISSGRFVANDTKLDIKDDLLMLITGPNMAGKSTYMRQVALITLLAQIGSFVPAQSASISICDRIFTRIGASDDLSAGKSTFMVEMWEVSNILKNATSKSLVILDEVGRGTSTYDGLSIAWSVIEHICSAHNLKCKTLFATHYHELTKLEGIIKGVKNYSVAVKEIGKEVIFLRKIVRGGADQSYGIEVAKLAGLPDSVIFRAKDILKSLESIDGNGKNQATDSRLSEVAADSMHKIRKPVQLSFADLEKEELIKDLASLDILTLTPMEGFNKLFELIKKAKDI